jgi:hypothetical protein
VYNYDRRGRGDSADIQPYSVEREVEDIEALIDESGGVANLYGHSSGRAMQVPFMYDAARALSNAIPYGELRTLENQTHDVDSHVLAPVLTEFFSR